MQLTVAAITKFYKANKAAVDSISGFEQFMSLSRQSKIVALCAVHRNRPYRKDVNFMASSTAAESNDAEDVDDDDDDELV